MQIIRLKIIEECDDVGIEEEYFSTYDNVLKRIDELFENECIFARMEIEPLEVD